MTELTRNERYERLNILDSKCTSLLQLTAILSAIEVIPIAASDAPTVVKLLGLLSVMTFVAVGLLAVGVLAVDWDPSEDEIKCRTAIYNRCRVLTRVGLVLGGLFATSAWVSSIGWHGILPH